MFHILKLTIFMLLGLGTAAFVLWFLCSLLLAVVTGMAMTDEDVERDYSVGRDVK